jgi:hypothetical protein
LALRTFALAAVVVTVPGLAGCDVFGALFNQEIDIPIDLESPEQEIDVTAPIAETEGSLCTNENDPSCVALKAFCSTDETLDCDTDPQLPVEFPKEVETIPGDPDSVVSAADFFEDSGLREAAEFEVIIPIDLGEQLADQGVQSPSAVKDVSFDNVSVAWPANTLTFDAPALDLYLSQEALDPLDDAAALIASGAVEKIGTIEAQPAGATDDRPIVFAEGGNELFNEALRNLQFGLVAAVPEGAGLTLKEKEGDPNTVLKPTGLATLKVKATLIYTVSAADIVDQASEAAE